MPTTTSQTTKGKDTSMLVIGRKNGKSSTRRQRRFPTVDAGERALVRWSKEGFNVFWTAVGDGPLDGPFDLGPDNTREPLRWTRSAVTHEPRSHQRPGFVAPRAVRPRNLRRSADNA